MKYTIRVQRQDQAFIDFSKDTAWTALDAERLKTLPQVARFIDNKVVFARELNEELERSGLSEHRGEFQGHYAPEISEDVT